jgi:hypothetical protein
MHDAGSGHEQPANDDDDVQLGLGLRYFGPHGISGSLQWQRRLGRQDGDEDRLSLLPRAQF